MKKKGTINVSGLSINDILSMTPQQLNSMSRTDLARVGARLVSASNKRVRRLEKAAYGTNAPAYSSYRKRGRPFSVKGKNVNEIRTEIKNMKHFLNMKTSTVSGWKRTQKNLSERLGGTMTEEQTEKFWSVYKRLEETEGGLLRIIGDSKRIQRLLHQEIVEDGERDVFQKMMDNLDQIYEEMFEQPSDEDVSDVFDFDEDI